MRRLGWQALTFGSALALLPTVLAAAPARRARKVAQAPTTIAPSDASERDRTIGQACQRGLGRERGSVVAMDPRTGRVIAVVNPAEAAERAYQPCSVFKIVVAIAGLSESVITRDSVRNCNRGCSYWPGHGAIDVRRALAVSCNPFFEHVGSELGYATVQRYAELLGLGAKSGINLALETPGLLPASVRPEAVAHLSSHAAGIATSAVQQAVLLSAVINGGTVFQPQVGGPVGFEPKPRWRLPAATRIDGLFDGFVTAVTEGTATPAFDAEVAVAGKTGTCSGLGWFASYAPAERPELVLVVFVRHGSGHEASAIAGRIFEDIYKGRPELSVAGAGH